MSSPALCSYSSNSQERAARFGSKLAHDGAMLLTLAQEEIGALSPNGIASSYMLPASSLALISV